MATLSARGLPQLANLFIRSRRLNPNRHKYQTLNLTYGRVLSLHYNFQRNCSTASNNKGAFIEELNEDADSLSTGTVRQNEDQHVESHEKALEECTSNILSSGRRSFQKVNTEYSDGEGENSLDSGQETQSKVLRGIGPTSDVENKRKHLDPDQPDNAKILRISIIGAPNAGKSTLTNSLMNWKVSSVSNKVHTTRKNTLAVLTEEETQIIFLDTPGVLDPAKRKRHNLEENMVTDPKDSVTKADMIGVLVDVSDTWTRNTLNKNVLKILHLNKHVPSILILNKVDLVKHKGVLLKLSHQLLNNKCGGKSLGKSEVGQPSKELKLDEVISEYHAKSKKGLMKDDFFDDYNDQRDYNDGYVGSIPEKKLQSFLSQTRDKIDHYRQEKDEKRMLKSKSAHVFDDIRFRLTLLSVDVNPALNSVTQKLLEENNVDEKKLNREVENETGWSHFSNVFMVSALQNDGIRELKDFLKDSAKPGDWQYHSSLVTDKSPQEVAISLVKEQILEKLGFEIPYKITPKIQEWSMTQRGLLVVMRLEAQRNRDMKYLIGRGGTTINLIQERASQEIRNALRCEVKLHLKCECLE